MKLRIAEGLSLPADAVTQTFGVLAKRGAGKSNAAAVLAEQLHAAGAQFVVVDPVGAWWGLRSSADGKGPGLSIAVLGGHHHDLPLDPGAGELVADLIVDERISCVLDVSAFDSESAKRRFLTSFANRLFRQKGRPGSGDPLHLFLEEADDYAPQVTGRGEGERGACLGAFQRLVKQGRARGIGCTMISQRSAALNKDLLTQIETLIVLRTTAPNDRKAIEGWVKYHDLDGKILASLSELAVGEAWVWSPSWLGIVKRVQMPRRTTYDSGATATGSSKSKPVATLADVDLTALRARMAATIEKAKADDPRELRKTIDSWKDWHRKLTSILGTPNERNVTLDAVRELAAAKKQAPKVERVEVPAISETIREQLHDACSNVVVVAREIENAGNVLVAALARWEQSRRDGRAAEGSRLESGRGKSTGGSNPSPSANKKVTENLSPKKFHSLPSSNGSVSAGERKILTALARYMSTGLSKKRLGAHAGYRADTGHFGNMLGSLRGHGYVAGEAQRLAITPEGIGALGDFEPLPAPGRELIAWWLEKVSAPAAKILAVLTDAYPESVHKAKVGELTGYRSDTGHFGNLLAELRGLGLIEGKGELRASEELFS